MPCSPAVPIRQRPIRLTRTKITWLKMPDPIAWHTWNTWAMRLGFAGQMHRMISYSPLFENFNMAEIRMMSQFMHVYRTGSGQEIIHEGEQGDFMLLMIEGSVEVFKQDRWNTPQLIASVDAGKTLGEMSMIDGERALRPASRPSLA
jgi:hypothetical protein